MTKKRKVCSPTQEEQSDICAELKRFIVQENAKCVKEIKDSNDRRLVAIEESLSFSMDALTAVSDRQRTATKDIVELQRETAELKRRLLQMELNEDRQEQERRLTCLVFSGPYLQAHTQREEALQLIRSVVHEYLKLKLDGAQVKTGFRTSNGKILIEFTSAAPGSDRDVLFRSKAKLRGSGLFIAESLTPRRQAIFSDLLQLKREKKIFSVFTRSGNILACRSRDTAPLRIADPEAVRQLSRSADRDPGGAAAPRRPAQGRAQVDVRGAPLDSTEGRQVRARAPAGVSGARAGTHREMEVEMCTPTGASGVPPSQRGSHPRHAREGGGAEGSPGPAGADESASDEVPESSPTSSLLVHLSTPLLRTPTTDDATSGRPADGGRGLAVTGGERGSPAISAAAVAQLSDAGQLEPPVPMTSEVGSSPLAASASGERRAVREASVSAEGSVLPSGGCRKKVTGAQPAGDGARGGVFRSPGNSVTGVGGQRGDGVTGRGAALAGDVRGRPSYGGSGAVRDSSRSRDIRDFF